MPDVRMSFLEHLQELRARLIRSLVAIGVGTGIGLFFCSAERSNDIGLSAAVEWRMVMARSLIVPSLPFRRSHAGHCRHECRGRQAYRGDPVCGLYLPGTEPAGDGDLQILLPEPGEVPRTDADPYSYWGVWRGWSLSFRQHRDDAPVDQGYQGGISVECGGHD